MMDFIIDEVPVSFPFHPYEVQLTYMEKVVKALRNGETALLESPTGTGKTLCLLCAALAWVQYEKSRFKDIRGEIYTGGRTVPQIIYCSRTHSQLSQVIHELKSSPYSKVKGALLGSREHFCAHREVSQLSHSGLRNHACRALRAENSCRYFSALRSTTKCYALENDEILDMEDLVYQGKTKLFCPYYLERELALDADIIFMPYNYVTDPALRKQLPFGLQKRCVVIIDEAHNLPAVLSSDGCLNITALSLATSIQDCSRCIAMLSVGREGDMMKGNEAKISENDVAALKIVLKRLEDLISSVDVREGTSREFFLSTLPGEFVRDGSYMYPFLEQAMIRSDVYFGSGEVLGMNSIMAETIKVLQKSDKNSKGLTAVYSFLENVFNAKDNEDLSSVKFVIQELQTTPSGGEKQSVSRSLGFWRLDISELRRIQDVAHALILTSGTLSPIDHFAAELNIRCDIELKGSHVIEEKQVLASILCKGPSGEKLNGSFVCRGSSDYLAALGMVLQNISRHVPGGTLVFFPSYASLYRTVDFWRAGRKDSSKTIWGLINECRPVFIEPTENSDLVTVIEKFKENAERKAGGAILLSVCRGKISEGVNFSDAHGRCVLVTGIPYANCADLFVRMKRKYLSEVASQRPKVQGKKFTGEDWYRTEAMRAVSQCVGRAIRHKNDYGALVFADERFKDLASCLPEWIHPSLSLGLQFRETFASIVNFFRSHETSLTSVVNANIVPSNVTEKGNTSSQSCYVPQPFLQKKAHEYMMDLQRKLQDTEKHQKKMRLDEVKELPRSTRNLPSFFSQQPSGKRALTGLLQKEETDCIAGAEKVHQAPEGCSLFDLPVRCNSKDFCRFLKSRLKPGLYEEFKELLVQISVLRQKKLHECSDSCKKELTTVFHKLVSIFKTIDLYDTKALMLKMGSYLPQELYSDYLEELKVVGRCHNAELNDELTVLDASL